MSPSVRDRIDAVMDRLKDSYESRGYVFLRHPRADVLPPFLQGLRPDAIAMRGAEKLVFDIWLGPRRKDGPSLTRLAEALAPHPDWRLVRVNGGDVVRDEDLPAPADAGQIAEALKQADDLAAAGHGRLAIVALWAVLEAQTRLLLAKRCQPAPVFMSPASIAEYLLMQGDIDGALGDRLGEALRMRDRIVHGDLALQPSAQAIEAVRDATKAVSGALAEDRRTAA